MRFGHGDKPMLWRLVLICVIVLPSVAAASDAGEVDHFETKIRPILATKCLKCHGEQKQEGELRLDSRAAMLRGGESGPAIVPGQADESLLLEALRYESFEMPPTGQLPESVIEEFASWIGEGASWPEHAAVIREAANSITEADREWWAFQPLEKPQVPDTPEDTWSENEVDRFVYHDLRTRSFTPAPPATKTTLIRRLYFDLIGLPPTPAEIEQFLNDESPEAYGQLVDRLLNDQRYGEHWARYWLDIVRYAESDGWNQDAYRPHIWRYRDYVVDAFNNDKPYPDFVREQLAGDELERDDPLDYAAAGFLRLGIYEYNQRDAKSHWDDITNELTDVVGDVFFGMGMACARCHDHKFDPVLQKDYFQLRAFFEPLVWRDDIQLATASELAEYEKRHEVWRAATREIQTEIDSVLKPYHDRKWKSTVEKFPLDIQACFHKDVQRRNSWEHQMAYLVSRQFEEEGGGPLKSIKKEDKERYDDLLEELAKFDELKPEPLPPLMTATDFEGTPSPTVIPDVGDSVEPGFLTVLNHKLDDRIEPTESSSGRRLALARWIGRPDNPLTTRVIVNRIWQEHFGQGLVATPNDFGHLGSRPSHPELLDWLTVDFVENGWSIKRLHKQIVMSQTWRQSAIHPQADQLQEQDPAGDRLWRARVRRLKAEQIRDAMLFASGELDLTQGGPSATGDSVRRSLYVKSLRNTPDEFMHAFDIANGLKSVAQRDTTTTPTQSLFMINGDYPLERAKKLSERLRAGGWGEAQELLRQGFLLTWGRPPTAPELQRALSYLDTSVDADPKGIDQAALTDFCHVLLNSNEFLYVD